MPRVDDASVPSHLSTYGRRELDQPSTNDRRCPKASFRPSCPGSLERLTAARVPLGRIDQDAFELAVWFLVERHQVDVIDAQRHRVQTRLNRSARERGIVLHPRETLLLGGSQDLAITDEA